MKTHFRIKLFLITVFLAAYPLMGYTQDSCKVYVVDAENGSPVLFSQVLLSEGETDSLGNGVFQIACEYTNSIIVRANGYQDKIVFYNGGIDTVLLELNTLTFEAVAVTAEKHQKKQFRIGKKNRFAKHLFSFGVGSSGRVKIASLFQNTSGKRKEIVEGYIYVLNRDSTTNLIASFFKNKNGQLGKPIQQNVIIGEINKQRGWCRFEFSESITFPKEGFFVVVQKINPDIDVSVGMLKYKKEMNLKSHAFFDSKMVHGERVFPFDDKCQKLYFIVK